MVTPTPALHQPSGTQLALSPTLQPMQHIGPLCCVSVILITTLPSIAILCAHHGVCATPHLTHLDHITVYNLAHRRYVHTTCRPQQRHVATILPLCHIEEITMYTNECTWWTMYVRSKLHSLPYWVNIHATVSDWRSLYVQSKLHRLPYWVYMSIDYKHEFAAMLLQFVWLY